MAERGAAPGPLFVTRTGAQLQRSYVLDLLKRLAGAAAIPDPHTLTPHAIRHSVATALLQAGEPLDVVQALLGHADPRTTRPTCTSTSWTAAPLTVPVGHQHPASSALTAATGRSLVIGCH
ncbi:tyrosine-type recombinase/integrase [Nonomuraea sp. NPDC049152]|uniref:tyrosine-type recombinase/integrase n=1 Tax=Nonomuraea sp. NPDC049152 TaxID=3154350 RepID=UPI0034115DC0